MQDKQKLIQVANRCWELGLNAIPCKEDKSPVGTWTEFQSRMITPEEFESRSNGHCRMGIVTGKVSYNLEVIDIDSKYDLTGDLANDYFKLIYDHDSEFFDSLHIVKTPTNGYHIYYRCEEIEPSTKLARRPATDVEKSEDYIKSFRKEIEKGTDEEKAKAIALKNSQSAVRVLIETRGNPAFIVCPPTPGYVPFQQREIPTISSEKRIFLFDAARTYNELEEQRDEDHPRSSFTGESKFDVTPWDDYNDRVTTHEIQSMLENHGWVKTKYAKKPRTFFTRPGKSDGVSADYNEDKKLFKVWSTSVGDFKTQHAYTPTSVFKILECNGDPSEASKKLEAAGYGKRKPAEIKQVQAASNTHEFAAKPLPNDLSEYDHLLITKEKQIPRWPPTITIGGGTFASPHNISVISGPPKGAKTAITGAMIAAAISETGQANGFPDIQALVNSEHKAVLNFGTEQSEEDEQYNVNNILSRAGLIKTPDFLRCYSMLALDYKNYEQETNNICRLCAVRFGGIHSIFIDGGADYIASVNDEKQSTDIVQFFRHLSIKFNCPVIIIVHQNPTAAKGVEKKERGHFGSHVQRKCYGLITLEKQGDIFSLQPKMLRRSGNEDMPLIQFKYSKEQGYHVQVDAQDQEAANDQKRWEKLRTLAVDIFSGQVSYRNKDAINRIMDHTKKGLSTAKTMLRDMEGFQFILNGDGYYRLNRSKVNLGQNQVNLTQGQ